MTGIARKLRITALAAAATVMTLTGAASAATVVGGSLLSNGDAGQLDTWLGTGDHIFTNIWSGAKNVATAGDFHSAVDGAGPTFSIYEMTIHDGSTALIGGYTAADWGGADGYVADTTAFIFNLTSLEVQYALTSPAQAVYRDTNYFSTFGAGHDLFGGWGTLATCDGVINTAPHGCHGYTLNHSYDPTQGQISVAGDSGIGSGDSGFNIRAPYVQRLEVYTIAAVPLPAGLPLLLGAFGALMILRGRKRRLSA